MPSITVIFSIVILVVSFIGGFVLFYLTSTDSRKMKKAKLDDMTSLLINFVIYIWIGKIIANLPTFIQDPLAILAYPSNSTAFYIATLLMAVNIVDRKIRKQQDIRQLGQSFLPVLLGALFSYEFLQVIVVGNRITWEALVLLMIVLVIFIVLYDKLSQAKSSFITFCIWMIGYLFISIFHSYATIFGYMIAPIYFIILFILAFPFFVYSRSE